MQAVPIPTMIDILSASELIRNAWSEPRRAARQQKATTRQRQLMGRLLVHVGNNRIIQETNHLVHAGCDAAAQRS